MITKIKKRSGEIAKFEPEKIKNAIHKAIIAVNEHDGRLAQRLANEVVDILSKRFKNKIPGVEDAQDIVEQVLIKGGFDKIVKSYRVYRKKRAEIRRLKSFFGVKDELKLSINALKVLKERYLLKDETGKIIETPSQIFRRVARHVASADERYGLNAKKTEEEFYSILSNLEFLPNSPTLMNAGTKLGQLSACFILPVGDSTEEIFDAVKYMAEIHRSGGGTGFSFSRLRPKGDIVTSTMGAASGPVSFMRVFDVTTDVIKQGGRRRGANMGILHVSHPDIEEFISSKAKGAFRNFNISVAVDDKFIRAVMKNKKYSLINPRTEKVVKRINAGLLFDLICTMAWETGDPGLIFIDEINKKHVLRKVGEIESTNPCGEVPALPYESCNLGSINLIKVVEHGKINWNKLRELVRLGVHFLDNVIDINKYPLREIEKVTKSNRKIGLGVMGLAEMLIKLNVPYDSDKALKLAEKLMKFISAEARKKSQELGEKRGSFPNFKKSMLCKKYKTMRNATVTAIAPTGTISIIAGTTSGIEPLFAISFVRNVMEGARLLETNKEFEEAMKKYSWGEELLEKIALTGSVQNIKEIPANVKKIFVTAHDIDYRWHLRMQAAFQRYTDNAVSKTINLRQENTVEDVKKIYLLAYKLKCKGITVYRYGSKPEQVLYIAPLGKKRSFTTAESEYSGGCPEPYCPF